MHSWASCWAASPGILLEVEALQADGRRMLEGVRQLGLEGIVLRRRTAVAGIRPGSR
jgi:hypothetical protein